MRRLVACLALALFASCGGDSATGPTSASVAGTWSLQTVNGAALPFVLAQDGADKLEVTGDVITAAENGTFSSLTHFRSTISGEVSEDDIADTGTWTLSGSSVTFRFTSDGTAGTASISGGTMTFTQGSTALKYTKQ